jgi:hypothetical protein
LLAFLKIAFWVPARHRQAPGAEPAKTNNEDAFLVSPHRFRLFRGSSVVLVLTLSGSLSACGGQADDGALEAVEWLKLEDANCQARHGEMLAVHSTHSDRTVVIWLDRLYMGVKTGDRGRHELAPGAPALELGCSATDGGSQHWELVDAKFAPG